MKMTDENVAQALGYVPFPWGGEKWCHFSNPHDQKSRRKKNILYPRHQLPAFTTSLDAIVAEIKARGLMYQLIWIGKGKDKAIGEVGPPLNQATARYAATEALALCAALLAYLKEKP